MDLWIGLQTTLARCPRRYGTFESPVQAAMNFINKQSDTASSKQTVVAGQKVVNLALQGGGSHGAFTWGVLDRLLEEEAFYFEGICGTSAGAANAVVLADGVAAGGRE